MADQVYLISETYLCFYFYFLFCSLSYIGVCLPVRLCAMCMQCPRRPEEGGRALESQLVVSCPMGVGKELDFSYPLPHLSSTPPPCYFYIMALALPQVRSHQQLLLHPLTSLRLEEGSPSFGMVCIFFSTKATSFLLFENFINVF